MRAIIMFKPTPTKPIPTPLPKDIEEKIDKNVFKFKTWIYTSDVYNETPNFELDEIIKEYELAMREIASLAYNRDRRANEVPSEPSSKITYGRSGCYL